MNPLQNAILFLINTLFDLYLFVLLIRILLAYSYADYFNPLSQFVIKLTQPIINPLRRVIPSYKNYELASIALFFTLEFVKFFLLGILLMNMPNPLGLIVLAIADAGKSIINLFFYAILLQVILSWVQPYSPIANMLSRLTSPLMRPIQRLVPPIGGIDISPIPAMIVLQLTTILLLNPLFALGQHVAFG